MSDLELLNERLGRLQERVHRLERAEEIPNEHMADGKRRVIACRIVDAVERVSFNGYSTLPADLRAMLERQIREILKEHRC